MAFIPSSLWLVVVKVAEGNCVWIFWALWRIYHVWYVADASCGNISFLFMSTWSSQKLMFPHFWLLQNVWPELCQDTLFCKDQLLVQICCHSPKYAMFSVLSDWFSQCWYMSRCWYFIVLLFFLHGNLRNLFDFFECLGYSAVIWS